MPATPLVALEIGTHRVRVVTGEAQANHHLVITGIGECASRGVRKSEIVDFDNALACVKAALQLAEEQAQLVIGQVHLLFSGGAIRSLINRGTVPVLNPAHVITREEIDDARENARAVSLAADREVIHSISQHFFIDDQAMVINPEGMEGARLSLDMLLLHGVRNRIRNTVRVASSAQVEVQEIAFGGLCSGLAVLTADQKESGVLVVDLGAGTTDYVVYAKKAIAHAGGVAVGGDHVTNDIACGLNLSITQAERLKTESGSARVDLARRNETVSLQAAGGFDERTVKLVDLHTIMNSRMEETLQLIRNDLVEANLLHGLGAGVLFTGGGSRLPDITRLGEQVFQLPCRIGIPVNVSGLALAAESPDFAAPIGMLKYGMRSLERDGTVSPIKNIFKSLFGK